MLLQCNKVPALCLTCPQVRESHCRDPQATCVRLLLKAGLAVCDTDLTLACSVKKQCGSVLLHWLIRETSQVVASLRDCWTHVCKNSQVEAQGVLHVTGLVTAVYKIADLIYFLDSRASIQDSPTSIDSVSDYCRSMCRHCQELHAPQP